MREMTYGWNLEMQMRAARAGLRIVEIPVAIAGAPAAYRRSPAICAGTLKASWRIAFTFGRIAVTRRPTT